MEDLRVPYRNIGIFHNRIGSGQFGRVYEGQYKKHSVVFKIMKHAIHTSIFFNEVKILHSISHPNIPRLYGYSICEEENIFCIIMERARGLDLFHCIRLTNISLEQKFRIARQILETLSYLHIKRILYRDLKPENVIVDTHSGFISLVDFGLAVQLEDDIDYVDGVAGTLGYIAPEVYEGLPYSFSADIYSFGMVLFFLFTEHDPQKPEFIKKMIKKKIPRSLRDIITSCIEPETREREDSVIHLLDIFPDSISGSFWSRFSSFLYSCVNKK